MQNFIILPAILLLFHLPLQEPPSAHRPWVSNAESLVSVRIVTGLMTRPGVASIPRKKQPKSFLYLRANILARQRLSVRTSFLAGNSTRSRRESCPVLSRSLAVISDPL